MTRNLGTADRAIRAILGIALITYGIINHSWIGAIGSLPLLTALIGFCPAYCPLGLRTTGKGGDCCGGGK
jgi:hypothetical protein